MTNRREAEQNIVSQTGPRVATGTLAIYGVSLFVTGLFILAAAGTDFTAGVYVWIALFACMVAVPIALVGVLAALIERMSGRVWLSSARPMAIKDRGARTTLSRGVRYASWIWLANGLALWIATIASQFPA